MRREDERADRRLQMDEERHRAEMANPDLDAAVQAKRKQILEGELNLELEMKRRGLENFKAADEAFYQFETGLKQIDWGNPDSLKQYGKLTEQYIHGITKDTRVFDKWAALDKVVKQGQAFAAKKMEEVSVLEAMNVAARIAPDLRLDPPKHPDGTLNMTEFAAQLREREAEKFERDFNLRQAAAARAGGKMTLDPVEQVKLDAMAEELKGVSQALTKESDANKVQSLLGRKSTIQRNLDNFGRRLRMSAAAPSSAGWGAPDGNAAPAAPVSGRFKIEIVDGDGIGHPISGSTAGPSHQPVDPATPPEAEGAPAPQAEPEPQRSAVAAPKPAKRETLVEYATRKAGHFERPPALTSFGTSAIVGRRAWDEKTAVRWALDRLTRLAESKVPRDIEERNHLRKLVEAEFE